ncbi:alpha/beta hydrolase [Pseudonocardia sp. NPDC049154]|uniref:alpha/beta hydrolase n=1 Tax=Pseudonocardia sp. NPDC049154 TaxID=3155501 RepID=UPI0033F26235
MSIPAPDPIPVVFVHGLWLHASSWTPWVELFTERGYAPVAPGWPGEAPTAEECRADPEAVANRGIAVVTDHFASLVSELPAQPIVIGHSFGGLIAEKLLGQGCARACIALSPAQFKGNLALPPAQLRTAFPVLSKPKLRTRSWIHSKDSWHAGFANAISREESDALYDAYAVPSPMKPLFQAATANFALHSEASVDVHRDRGPVLVVGAGKDRTVPEATSRAAHRILSRSPGVTEWAAFPAAGHSFAVDSTWREAADLALEFLARHGMGSANPAGAAAPADPAPA